MASDRKDIQQVLKQERSRGRKTPALSEEAYAEKLRNERFIKDLLTLPFDRYKEALMSVAGLREGTPQYDLAIQAWNDYQYETHHRSQR